MTENTSNDHSKANEGADPSQKSAHWSKLAETLGAKAVVEEPPRPQPAVASDTTKKASLVKKERVERVTPPPRSHWKALASLLGLGGSAAEEVDVESESDASTAPAEPSQPKSTSVAEITVEAVREVEVSQTPSSSPVGFDTPAMKLGINFEEDETDITRAKSRTVLDSLFKPSPVPYWETEADESEESIVDDVEAVRFERHDDLGVDDEDLESSFGGDDPQVQRDRGSDRSRPRRRRRRRGARPNSAGDKAEVTAEDVSLSPSDSTLRLEASAELFDRDDVDLTEETDDDRPESDEPKGSERQRERKRVTSWDEAISVIIERNLKSRGAGGGGQSRSSRGKRR